MLAKQGWRILSSLSSLLARVLMARYFPNSSFLESKVGRLPSFTWRSILWSRDVLLKGLRWKIGNGESVRVYKDSWLPRDFAFRVFSPRILPEGVTVLALLQEPCFWHVDVVRRHFIHEEADLILSLPLSLHPRMDSFFFIDDFLAANLPPSSSPFCSGSGPDLAAFSSSWKASPAAVFKLNVDASCNVLSGCSGLGMVVRNATGIVVFAAAVPLKFCADVDVVEAKAILAGIQLTAERGLLPLLVEMDSFNVSHLCNGDLLSRSNIENIIFNIQSLMSSLNIASISFISMLGNGVAHGIAKRAFDLVVPCLWICSFPVWLAKLFQVDVVFFSSPIGE
ncbi:hypothetical protein ACOSP7_003032 [Xanthoceras sorbifolium]